MNKLLHQLGRADEEPSRQNSFLKNNSRFFDSNIFNPKHSILMKSELEKGLLP